MQKEMERPFLDWLAVQGYAERSVLSYRKGLHPFWRFVETRGVADAGEVSAALVSDYQVALIDYVSPRTHRALRPTSHDNYLGALITFGRFLFKTHRIGVNPTAHIHLKQHPAAMPVLPSSEEIRRLLDVPDTRTLLGFRDRTMLEILWSSGPRVTELVSLTLEDVRIEDELLTIRRGKGGNQRVVPLGEGALAWLCAYVERVRPWLHAHRNRKPLLFLSLLGGAMNGAEFSSRLRAYLRRSRIDKRVTVHTFRHVLATEMLRAGADLRHIQELLGHHNLTTTQRYTHVIKEELKKVHERTHPRERLPVAPVAYRGTRGEPDGLRES